MHHHVHKKAGPAVKEWDLLWALFTTQDPHQQELLCNELLQLPAARIHRYLLEYVYLAVSRPSGPLERAITELCGRSFNTAVQVSWLLLALLEDQPSNRHIQHFRDACERAALTGGQPSKPHYLQTFAQQQLYQQPSPYSNSPSAVTSASDSAAAAADTEATSAVAEAAAAVAAAAAAAFQVASNGVAFAPPAASNSDASSAAASPFAFPAASEFNSSRPSSPCRSPSAAVALAASTGSLSGSHRFRDSLDLELMKHASQDLASSASRTPTGLQQSAQQQHKADANTSAQNRAKRQQQGASSASSPDKQPQEQKQQQQQQQPRLEVRQQADHLAVTGIPNGLASICTSRDGHGSSRQHSSRGSKSPHARGWAMPGSVAAGYSCFEEYFAARDAQLTADLGRGQGVSQLIAASHDVAVHNAPHGVGWLVTHEEELMSTSMLMEMPPRSPRHAAGRDCYLATLDFVEALCETSSSLTRFPPAERRKVLRRCLGRINQEVMDAAEQGVAVRYPVGGCRSRVLRLLANDAVILNSRDKAPFLLMLEVQEDADFVEEVLPGDGSGSSTALPSISPARSPGLLTPHTPQGTEAGSAFAAPGANDVLPCSPDQQQEHTSRPLQSRQQQLLQQLHHHLQQQQQRRPHSGHHGAAVAVGTSPLSRSSSPAPASPQRQQQHLQQQHKVAGAAAPPVISAAAASGELVSPAAAHISNVLAAPAAKSSSTNIPTELALGSATAMQRPHQQLHVGEQQEQPQHQQPGTAPLWGAAGCSPAGSQLQQRSSSPAPQDSAAAAAVAPGSVAARPAAATRLELQMQEAAAVLRGDKLIRLQIAVAQPATAAAGSSRSGPGTRPQTAASEDDDSSFGPWVFGELPACSSSEDISKQAAGGGADVSRHRCATCSSLQGQLVSVQLEVVESAPVTQQLLLHHKTRRRLPSMEAIDIIAGKLGKADIPPPTEIGPPLQLTTELSASSRSSSGSIDADMFCNVPLSPAILATVTEGVPASDEVYTTATGGIVAPATAGVAGEERSSASDGDLASRLSTAAAVAAATGVALPVGGSTDAADTAQTRLGKAAAKPEQQKQADVDAATARGAAAHAAHNKDAASKQQQQPKTSAGWWGFLRKQQQLGSPSALQQQNGNLQGYQAELDAAAEAEAEAEALSKQADQVYGERWAARSSCLRAASPFGSRPGWGLTGVIVKSGDDCRQELLAVQLIRELAEIWAAAELPLWVLPFEVLVTSSGTALIQLIPDATSVHSIKAHTTKYSSSAAAGTPRAAARAAAGAKTARKARSAAAGSVSLSDHFFAKWKRGTPECLAAQRRFVESLAGYSLVTYLLQVKDRHNGNIMMDSQGHLIHIDYGFMLSNAPGGNWVRFEAAPMKLTRELLEVMDSDSEGQTSDLFDYFKVLCIQGFLAARKQHHRITGLVRIMADCSRPGALCPTGLFGIPPSSDKAASSGSSYSGIQAPSWPCFQAGADRVVAALESRFAPQLSEGACVQHVLRLISHSLDAWSTRQYDYYQRVLNGIL